MLKIFKEHYKLEKKELIIFGISIGFIEIIQLLLFKLIIGHFLIYLLFEIFIHYIFFIYTGHLIIFPGSSKLMTKLNCWKIGRETSNYFNKELEEFKESLNDFYTTSSKILGLNEIYSKLAKITSINDLIYSYLKLSNIVPDKDMSSYQKNMVVSLERLKMAIEESRISKLMSDRVVLLNKNKTKEFKNEKLNKSLDKIKDNINIVTEQIKSFQLEGNFLQNILNFIFNDSFGSLKQLKSDLLSRFYCDNFKVSIHSNENYIFKDINLDCLLIKTKKKKEEEKNINKEKIIIEENAENNINSENNINTDMNILPTEKPLIINKNTNTNVIIICNKSLYPYELAGNYEKWIEFYLRLGINVILYNYRGYGESNGFSTIDNIQSDLIEIINYIKGKYGFQKIGVHGVNLGCIPASYSYYKNIINLCFIDRTYGSLFNFIESKLNFKYTKFLLKMLFITDCNLVTYLNSNLKKQENEIFATKIISYDLKNDFINEKESLKTLMAFDFYNKLINKNDNNKNLIRNILNEHEKEYELFESELFYILQKISNFIEESKDYRIEFNSIMQTLDVNIDNDNEETVGRLNKDDAKIFDSNRVLKSIQNAFEKLDAGGETLLSLYNKFNIYTSKEDMINIFFTNLFSWGSYKLKDFYASDLLVAYKAVAKKLNLICNKFDKILKDPKKYEINDCVLSSSLKTVLDGLNKIEKFFHENLSIEVNDNSLSQDDSTGNSFEKNKLFDTSSVEMLNKVDLENNSKIIEFIKKANLGNLLILNIGEEGKFSSDEIKAYTIFLYNSEFVKDFN